jgi:RNAse (barnase) inhibitor barstar
MKQYTLDLTDILRATQFHPIVAQMFQFPDYYGKNWDAFEDCMDDFLVTNLPIMESIELTIVGLSSKSTYRKSLLIILGALQSQYPQFTFTANIRQ